MISAGWMYKHVVARPSWLQAPGVEDICSVSGCVSDDFADWFGMWRHNGHWLFDSPRVMEDLAREQGIDLSGTTLFFYELHPEQWDVARGRWEPFGPEPSVPTAVELPEDRELLGHDVVTYSQGNAAECSPLSCNHVAEAVQCNAHCLLDSREAAMALVEAGAFDDCEPGPLRIVDVFRVRTS